MRIGMAKILGAIFVLSFILQSKPIFGEEQKISTRPKGVSPQLASLYQERDEFECLDGSKTIPFEQVNDDYCDCVDGSDEPGTSACKNGKFYCTNAGFKPQTIPSSRVNDFICDCCDGSDEWDSGTDCPNVCHALGSKAREEAQQQREIHTAGYAKRVELAKEGEKLMEQKKAEMDKKRIELEQLEAMKSSAEERKNAAEELESDAKKKQDDVWEEQKSEIRKAAAEHLFNAIDVDSDGKVTAAEMKKHVGSEEEAEESPLLKEVFGNGDHLESAAFLEAFDKVREYIREMREEKKKQQREKEESEKHTQPAEEEGEGENKGTEEEPEDVVSRPPYDETTEELIKKAEEARKEFEEIVNKVADLERAIKDSESFLGFEYGPDHAWASLKGECAELTTTQYTYKLCLFDRTVQKDRNGHSEINLGYWGKWEAENQRFDVQLYEHGLTCWNGPERSTRVEFECGEQFQLVDASEPSKCAYHFRAKVPAVCADPEELVKGEHAEL